MSEISRHGRDRYWTKHVSEFLPTPQDRVNRNELESWRVLNIGIKKVLMVQAATVLHKI